MRHVLVLTAIVSAAVLSSCSKTTAPEASKSSFALLQQKVFDVSCTQCHNDAQQNIYGNLSLASNSSYASLIGVSPSNARALTLGLFRVKAGSPDSSFLLDKVTGALDSLMGVRMPQEEQPLSQNKIEFIREWIAAGAPEEGTVADASLLNDSGTTQAALIPLPPPPLDSGFQLHLPPFSIPPGNEREVFTYVDPRLPTTEWVKSLDFRMREGSHHFILWTLDGQSEGVTDGETRDRTDLEMDRPTRRFVYGAQTPEVHYAFPDGVALPIDPSHGFDLNSHYVNTTSETFFGEAYINVWTVPQSQVQHVAQSFLDGDFDPSFVIPSHKTVVRTMNWGGFSQPTHLFLLSSHAHARMLSFKIFLRRANGNVTQIYESDDWHKPIVSSMDLLLEAGDVVFSETTYKNDTDHDIHFGYTSEDEMNVVYGYYWQ
jgi:hypothetical protein